MAFPAAAEVPDPKTPSGRAALAAAAVNQRFGHRLLHLPGTWLGAIARPARDWADLRGPWHYWWQAHYLDCLVDAGLRELVDTSTSDADPEVADRTVVLAVRLVRGIRLRNLLRWANHYYDDMAWLALSIGRLDALTAAAGGPGPHRHALSALGARLDSAHTPDLGGGLFWNTDRTFKNTPATAPAALVLTRAGDRNSGQALVDWLHEHLYDDDDGLYLDGVRIVDDRPVTDSAVYSYNQGPVLGALLELGGAGNLSRAADLVAAVGSGLATTVDGCPVLRTHGCGDGGLFTGILARYLGQAAGTADLPEAARARAGSLVTGTAEALWAGRAPLRLQAAEVPLFPADPIRPTAGARTADGDAVELSTQLQAWMIFEAAARLAC